VAVFNYKGLDGRGKQVSGIVDAESTKAARQKLKATGIFPTDITEQAEAQEKSAIRMDVAQLFARVSQPELAMMTRQMATLTRADLPLVASLDALTEQTENAQFKAILTSVREKVQEGSALHVAFADFPRVFPPIYTNMVAAGEQSGALDGVLERLAEYLEKQLALRSRIRSTLAYPIVMLFVSLGIVSFLVTVVIPKITKIFADTGQILPPTTQALISLSNFTREYWWAMGGLAIALIYGLRRYIRTPGGKRVWDRFVLRVPIFGRLARLVAVSRFTRTLATLLSSGIPLLRSLEIVKNVVGNTVLEEAIVEATEAIREGASIADPLRRTGIFPPIVIHMIAVGEKSGELEPMLVKVAETYDLEVDTTITTLTSLLEPLLILVMSGVVLFIILAVLLPICELSNIAM